MILALVTPAWAYGLEDWSWDPQRFPLAWCAEGESDSWSNDELVAEVANAAGYWELSGHCVPPFFEPVDDCADADVEIVVTDEAGTDLTELIFQDDDPSLLDHARVELDAEWALVLGGQTCEGGAYVNSLVVHGLGHVLGLGHSCEQEEICLDTDELEAAMYWSMPSCAWLVPNEDDYAGLDELYDRVHALSWTARQEGAEVCFELDQATPEGLTPSWIFGNESSGEADRWSPCHTFLGSGDHSVRVRVTDDDGCRLEGDVTSWTIRVDGQGGAEDEEGGAGPSCGCAGHSPGLVLLPLVGVLVRRRK